MKAIQFQSHGSEERLEAILLDTPSPGPGEVLVRVTSAGLNRADVLFVEGRYFQKATLPSRVGMEPAGVVENVGTCTEWTPGDRVGVLPSSFPISAQGGIAEYVVVPAECLVATPDNLDDRDAGAIWMQYLTVWGALKWLVPMQRGQFVVVTAASSSVGLAAIEMCNASGAISIATTTSADKVARLKEHGAEHVIDVTSEDYNARVKAITGGKGVDIVFDAVGGTAMSGHVRACAAHASIILYGLLDTRPMDCAPGLLIGKQIKLMGYTVRALQENREALGRAVREIKDGVESGQLRPVVDRRFPMTETRDAFAYMKSNLQFGKIVINPWAK